MGIGGIMKPPETKLTIEYMESGDLRNEIPSDFTGWVKIKSGRGWDVSYGHFINGIMACIGGYSWLSFNKDGKIQGEYHVGRKWFIYAKNYWAEMYIRFKGTEYETDILAAMLGSD